MRKNIKTTRIKQYPAFVVIAACLLAAVGFMGSFQGKTGAESIDELREKSAQLQSEINEANRKAAELADQASSLEKAVAELDIQIEQATKEIELTNVKIAELEEELRITQAELERQKDLLKANMRALYKRGGASTVEMLAASDSFTEFINDQEYLERLKVSIQQSTERVIALKQQIQAQQTEQKALLAKQEAAKLSLDNTRAERANLLEATRGEEARFREYSRSLADRQREINRELLRRSRIVSTGGSGNYPWAHALCSITHQVDGGCWDYEWYVDSFWNRQDPWGYYYRNCTSYVAWRSAQNGLEVPGLGNGGAWASNAWKHNLPTGKTPKRGAFAVFTTGGYGHVAYVEDIKGGEVLISEYNFVADGVYSERWIPQNQPTSYVYTPWSY